MNRILRMSLCAVLMIAMTVSYFTVLATPATATQSVEVENAQVATPSERPLSVDLGATKLTSVTADSKIDAMLAEKMQRTMGLLKVYVLVTDRDAVNPYLKANGLLEITGAQVPGLPTTRVMELYPSQIAELAKNPGVYRIMTYEEPVFDDVPVERALEDVPVDIATPGTEDFDVDYLHGAVDAWMEGFTGSGVKIAVIDTGMDMSHPDLQGQQARYEDPSSPYDGWPIAYDDRAAYYWANDMIGGWVADTSATSADLGGYVSFDGRDYNIAGLQDVMGNPVVSQSGVYHIGYHTDQNLMVLWDDYIGVLVVDAVTPGWYDTVYVDVTDDLDFANDKACTKGDEISYFDFYDTWTSNEDWTRWDGGDGYADLGGGMVYWISDGVNMLPGVDWLYGGSFVPTSGDAVAFVGEFSYGESHGTMTSSAALATGTSFFGQLGGMAPDAKLIAIPFTNDVVASWLFAELGADGVPYTGDEANIVSNSYGYSDTAIEAGYTIYDMYTSYISLISAQTLWFWSTGNGGPGYGTTHSPVDFLSVRCGATTTMQYRYWLGYEEYYEYTTYGDMAPFSNSGPSRTGKLNAEISASGMYSMEPAPLNEYTPYGGVGDGFVHFQLGSGTSHATPTVAGGAALGYQAFFQLYSDWPWIDYAKAKLIASADDMHYDPLKQGAGWLNASTYARTMGEYAGVDSILYNEPVLYNAVLYPGSYDGTMMGTSYDNFPNFLLPDEVDDTHIVTTTNYDPVDDANVTISGDLLLLTSSTSMDWMTPDSGDQWIDIKPLIPAGTDLVKLTWYMPMDEFDPELDYVSNYQYWLETHDWVDTNGDGNMNITGGEWELYRMAVDGSDCNYNQISVRDPLERSHDGLIVRVRSIDGAAGLDMSLQVDSYELQTFDWLQFRLVGDPAYSTTLVEMIPAMSSIDWQVEVYVPDDAYVGTYAGAIYVDDGVRVQCIPVVINVPATDYEFSFGGSNYFDTPYNNDITGEADKAWRFEVGDWRMYWCLPSYTPPAEAQLIVSVGWSDLPTDVNVHVLAAVDAGGWDTFAPPFGPDLLEMAIASSNERYMGSGTFGVGTSTGGPLEVIAAPLGEYIADTGPAPFAIVTRCPVMDGYQAKDTIWGYTSWLTMNDYGPSSVYGAGQSGWTPGWYDITVGGWVEARGGGIGPLRTDTYSSEEIYQDAMTGSFVADLANAAYTREVTLTSSSILAVSTDEVFGVPDLDLGLWYDENLDGIAELYEPYWYVGISGSSESLTLENPADGQYLIKCLGYTVTGDPGYFDLTVMMGVPGYITVSVYEGWVTSGYHDFEIDWEVPYETGTYFGLATFGFMGADDMFSIPVTIVVDATPPSVENLYPEDGGTVGSASVVVTFDLVDEGSYSVGVDWWSLQIGIDGLWYFWTGSPQLQISDPAVTLRIPVTLSEGTHTIEIWASDNWGNWMYQMTSFTVNSIFETFTAEWVIPHSGVPVLDGVTVSTTNMIIRGLTDPFATVSATSQWDSISTSANETGYYELYPVNIDDGLNIVTVTATNDGGATASILKMINVDRYCALVVFETPEVTNDPDLEIIGLTEPGATVIVNEVGFLADPDGTFEAHVTLTEGPNAIYVNATDAVDNTNNIVIDVVLDTTPPDLVISGPADGSNVSEPSVLVYGTTEAGATVWVNGVVASDGSADWAATIVLSEGVNVVIVTAEDEVGNAALQTVSVEYIPPDYVTPEELAAVQEMLLDLIGNVSASLTENVSALQGMIDDLTASLAENVSDLQGQLDGLSTALAENISALQSEIDTAVADISALQTALAENVSALQGEIDAAVADIAALEESLLENVSALQSEIDVAVADISALQAALAENVTALQAADGQLAADIQASVNALTTAIASNVSALQTLIDALEGNVNDLQAALADDVADLQDQIDQLSADVQAGLDALESDMSDLNSTIHDDLTDLQDQIDGLNQTTQDDINDVQDQTSDVDSFAGMLMYLTLILFAIAIILIGVVWYVMNGKIGGGGSGGSAQSLEEVDEAPSEVEREFEQLEKEIKKEER